MRTLPRLQRTAHIARTGTVLPGPCGGFVEPASALFVAGVLVAQASPDSTAAWSWKETGLVLFALSPLVLLGIPGALMALWHPWAATTLRTQEWQFKHPRLMGLAELWAGILLSGWLSAMILLRLSAPLSPIVWAVCLLGFGPLYAIMLFDRR